MRAKAAQDQLDAVTKQHADLAQEMQQREDAAKAASQQAAAARDEAQAGARQAAARSGRAGRIYSA